MAIRMAGYRVTDSPAAENHMRKISFFLRETGSESVPQNFPASVCATEPQPNLALQERMQPGTQGQAGVPATQGNTRSGKGVHFLYTTGRVRTKTSGNTHFQRAAGTLYLGGSTDTHKQGSRVSYWGGLDFLSVPQVGMLLLKSHRQSPQNV